MASVPYINYKEPREFYSIVEVCKLFGMEKSEFRKKCEKSDIQPRGNEIGEHSFVKCDVRKLLNAIRRKAAGQHTRKDALWA